MKKTIRIGAVLLLALLLLLPQTAPLAEGGLTGYVYDLAELLEPVDWQSLNVRAGEVSQAHKCNIYVVTVADYKEKGGEDLSSYCEYLYTNNDMGYGQDKDGILLLVSLAEGDLFAQVNGPWASSAFSHYALDEMLEAVLDYLNRDDWAGGFGKYIDECDRILTLAEAGTPAAAPAGAYKYVFDQAGILTQDEIYDLDQRCQSVQDARGCAVYILTVPDYQDGWNGSFQDYCEGYYLRNGLGAGAEQNGVMLILSMADRDYGIYAYGSKGNGAFTDYAKDVVMPRRFLDQFKQNNWYGGFYNFVTAADEFLMQYNQGSPVDDYSYSREDTGPNYGFIVIVALIISMIVALIATSIMKAKLKTARIATEAANYMTGSPRMAIVRDVFTHVTEHREPIVEQRASSGGGGGGGTTLTSHGGSFSSGKF